MLFHLFLRHVSGFDSKASLSINSFRCHWRRLLIKSTRLWHWHMTEKTLLPMRLFLAAILPIHHNSFRCFHVVFLWILLLLKISFKQPVDYILQDFESTVSRIDSLWLTLNGLLHVQWLWPLLCFCDQLKQRSSLSIQLSHVQLKQRSIISYQLVVIWPGL